ATGVTDTDEDGIDDAFEESLGGLDILSADGDADGDGIKDVNETRNGTNPQEQDSDGDGLSDGIETGTGVFASALDTGTSPLKSDTDLDGLDDGAELGAETDPHNPDSDGDGFSDGGEVADGSDPKDANSVPSFLSNVDLRVDTIGNYATMQANGWDLLDATFEATVDFESKTEGERELIWESGGATVGFSLVYEAESKLVLRAVGNGGNDVATLEYPLTADQIAAGDLALIWTFDVDDGADMQVIALYIDGTSVGSVTMDLQPDWTGSNGSSFGAASTNLAAAGGNVALTAVDFTSGTINVGKGLIFYSDFLFSLPTIELPEGAIAGGPELAGADGLSGYYWNLGIKEIPTSGEPMHREGDGPDGADTSNSGWADNNVFNSRSVTGSFNATTFQYEGNDLTPIGEWLGEDAASYSGADGNLDDGLFRMVGYVYAAEPGEKTITLDNGSDDGLVIYIGEEAIVENDNGHGEGDPVSGTYNFPAEGYYPIDIRYFNGDWTNDAGDHGGANFRNNNLADLTLVQSVDGVDPFYTPPAPTGGDDGKNVIWISQLESEAGAEFQQLLTDAGHTVTEMFIMDPTPDEQAMLNAADLVIVSRKVNSGDYNNQTWDQTITAPLLLMSPYLSRSNRWIWFEANGLADETPAEITANESSHPVFEGLSIAGGVTGPWHTEVDRGTSLASDPVANGGTLIASSPSGAVVVAEWPADTVAVGPRLMFLAGSRELDGEGIETAGKFNLTADGETAFLNAVSHIAGGASDPAPLEGLLGYWRFNEGSGAQATDSSGNGNHGTIVAPDGVWENDPTLGSVYRSNEESYIDFGTIMPVLTLDNDFTWSFWVNADETDNNDIVFGNRWGPDGADFAPREFIKFTPRVFEWHVDGGGQNIMGDAQLLPVGEWVHNLVTKSGTTLTYYRNGAEIASGEITAAPANAQPFYIGGQNGQEAFSGAFEEAALFGRALSAEEATDVYNRGLNGQALGGADEPVDGPTSGIGVSRTGDGALQIALPAGQSFDIQYSQDLITWEDIASGVSDSFEDSDATRTARPDGYYRAMLK
ncbi:MAG: LamG-like jellyroll fold domain-containing protein, partial [Verrucomicrobiota bacterium]